MSLCTNSDCPITAFIRNKSAEFKKRELHQGFFVNESPLYTDMNAAAVTPFWQNPRELLWSKTFRNFSGRTRNSSIAWLNAGMGAVVFICFLIQDLAAPYAVAQVALSGLEQFTLDQESGSGRRGFSSSDFAQANSNRKK
jgi:hypothetical protein